MTKIDVYDTEAEAIEKAAEEKGWNIAEVVEALVDYIDQI